MHLKNCLFLWFLCTVHRSIHIKSESKRGIFESTDFWNVIDKPVLANGHIGFVPYGNSIYMNGLYNGFKGDSHRARIPNHANVQLTPCSQHRKDSEECSYALDIYNAYFRTSVELMDGLFTAEHIQYAHRYHKTALVNQIRLKRNHILTENRNCKRENIFFKKFFRKNVFDDKYGFFLKKIFF